MSTLVSVRSVWQEPDASLHITGDVEIEKFSAFNLEYTPTSLLHYDLFAQATDEFFSVAGTLSLSATTGCVRCLEDFTVVVNAPVDEMYFFTEVEDEEGEPYPMIDENAELDLLPAFLEAVVSEAPFSPVHDDSCKGLCTVCGINLNTGSCDCDDRPDPTHPFAGLKDLIKPTENEGEDR